MNLFLDPGQACDVLMAVDRYVKHVQSFGSPERAARIRDLHEYLKAQMHVASDAVDDGITIPTPPAEVINVPHLYITTCPHGPSAYEWNVVHQDTFETLARGMEETQFNAYRHARLVRNHLLSTWREKHPTG